MAGSYWIKLDWNWREDPNMMEFEDEYGKAALVDVIQLFCVMSEFYGELNMNEKSQRLKAQKSMGMNEEHLRSFITNVAECGIVSHSKWVATGKVSSERSLKDGKARRTRKEASAIAAEASAEKRRSQTAQFERDA